MQAKIIPACTKLCYLFTFGKPCRSELTVEQIWKKGYTLEKNRKEIYKSMDEQYAKLEELLNYYSENYDNINLDQEIIKQLLHETQEIFDYLPSDVLQRISDKLGIKLPTLTTLVKLIPSLKGENFKHKITVCSGPRCGAKGGAEILSAVEKELNIKPGKVTKDGTFLLVTQNCLKKCKTSPNMKIDQDIYNNVTVQNIPDIIKKYRK